VGVWNVRENVRHALTTKPYTYDCLDAALNHVDRVMDISKKTWIASSGILKDYMTQRRIEDYL